MIESEVGSTCNFHADDINNTKISITRNELIFKFTQIVKGLVYGVIKPEQLSKMSERNLSCFMFKFAKMGYPGLMEDMIKLGANVYIKSLEGIFPDINIIEAIIIGHYNNPLTFSESIRIISKYNPEKKIKRYIYSTLFIQNRNFNLQSKFAINYINSCEIV